MQMCDLRFMMQQSVCELCTVQKMCVKKYTEGAQKGVRKWYEEYKRKSRVDRERE